MTHGPSNFHKNLPFVRQCAWARIRFSERGQSGEVGHDILGSLELGSQTLEPNCLGSNPSSTAYQLCDLEHDTLPRWALVLTIQCG